MHYAAVCPAMLPMANLSLVASPLDRARAKYSAVAPRWRVRTHLLVLLAQDLDGRARHAYEPSHAEEREGERDGHGAKQGRVCALAHEELGAQVQEGRRDLPEQGLKASH